jgi:hypothetical protein
MSKSEDERRQRLAEALRQNLRRRKAQARAGTAVERGQCGSQDPLHQPATGPPPRSGED